MQKTDSDALASSIEVVLSLFDGSEPTDKQAVREMELAKRIIDRHYDNRWLLGYHHQEMDGFSYCYADGRYEELAQRAREDREAEARLVAKEVAA